MKEVYAVVMIADINGDEVIQTIIGLFKEEETAKEYAKAHSNIWNRYTTIAITTDLF